MKAAVRSDIGAVRESNEDTVLIDMDAGIFLLADGMGGHKGGEVASDLAVQTAHRCLREQVPETETVNLPRLLAEALASAHSAVSTMGLKEERLSGMGTTLEMLVIKNSHAVICHLGDSRIYLFRHDRLKPLTTDDNVAAWLSAGKGVADETTLHFARNMLTQAVGVSDELIPEIQSIYLLPEDLFMLCSDGLTGMLSDAEISQVINRHRTDIDAASETLVQKANRRGGHDNISVILVEPEAAVSDMKLLTGLPAKELLC